MPGMAVAEHLRAQGWSIAWMGNAEGMEAKLTAGKGYEMAWVRFLGTCAARACCASCCCPSTCCAASAQAWREIGRIRPDVVLGMGGYVSFPGGMMAALRGVPLLLHEQNSVAGLANRVLAGVADKVMTGFPGVSRTRCNGSAIRCVPKSPCCQRRLSDMPHTMDRCGCWSLAAASAPRRLNEALAQGAGADRGTGPPHCRAPVRREASADAEEPVCVRRGQGRMRGLHRGHGRRLRLGRPGDLPRRRADRG
jgi:hypothetical protein